MRKVVLFALVLALMVLAVVLTTEGPTPGGRDLDQEGASPTPSARTTAERTSAPARLGGTLRPPPGFHAEAPNARAVLRGVVLDPEGDPTSGSVVQLWHWIPRTNSNGVPLKVMDQVGTRRSDASGRFAFLDLDPGAYWTTLLVPPGLLSRRQDFELIPGEEKEVTLAFVRAMVVRIDVRTEQGDPIVGAWVVLHRGSQRLTSAKTDAHGTATLWSVDPAWVCRLEVLPPNEDAERLLRGVHLDWRPGDDTVVLKPAHTVSGRVVDERGLPVARAVVLRRGPGDGEHWVGSNTTADGRFRFTGLHPGKMALRAGPPGRRPPASSKEVVVAIGRDDVRLVVSRGGTRTIRIGNHAVPLARSSALRSVALTPYGRPEDQRTFRVERDGTVEAMGLEDGTAYVLWGLFPGSTPHYVHATGVRAGPEPLTLQIEEGGTIGCVVRAPEGVRVLGVSLRGPGVSRSHVPVPRVEGVYEIVGVPPGTWTIVAFGSRMGAARFDPEHIWQATTTAGAGDEVELELKPLDPH